MLKNSYLLAKIGADTAENEQHFAEILPIGRRVADCKAGHRNGRVGVKVALAHLLHRRELDDELELLRNLLGAAAHGRPHVESNDFSEVRMHEQAALDLCTIHEDTREKGTVL